MGLLAMSKEDFLSVDTRVSPVSSLYEAEGKLPEKNKQTLFKY